MTIDIDRRIVANIRIEGLCGQHPIGIIVFLFERNEGLRINPELFRWISLMPGYHFDNLREMIRNRFRPFQNHVVVGNQKRNITGRENLEF